MKKTVWTFGLICGAALSAMMLITMPFAERLGYGTAEVIGYTSIVTSFLLIFFGIRSYRENTAGQSVSFGRAFSVGVLINLVASICYAVTWQVIYYKVAPDFGEKYGEYVIERERAGGASAQELAVKQAQIQRYAELFKNPFINAAITFLEPFSIGSVVAMLSAGILRRRRRSPALGEYEAAEPAGVTG